MMENTQVSQIAAEASELFKAVMNLYSEILDTLELYIKNTPESEFQKLKELNQLIDEVTDALEHDISVFSDALNSDKEDFVKMQDKLQIESIYKKLNLK